MSPPRSDALVIFGVSGDVAYKKIPPPLQAMSQHGDLDVSVVGVASSDCTLEQLRTPAPRFGVSRKPGQAQPVAEAPQPAASRARCLSRSLSWR